MWAGYSYSKNGYKVAVVIKDSSSKLLYLLLLRCFRNSQKVPVFETRFICVNITLF